MSHRAQAIGWQGLWSVRPSSSAFRVLLFFSQEDITYWLEDLSCFSVTLTFMTSPKTLPRQGCLIRNQEWEPAEVLFGGNTIQLMTGAFKHIPCVFLSTHSSLSLASSYFVHLCFTFLCCFCRAWAGSVPRSLDSWPLPQCFPDSCCSINICWLTAWLFGCHGTLTFSRLAEATRSCRLSNRPPQQMHFWF